MESKKSHLEDIDTSYSGVTALIDVDELAAEEFMTRCATDIIELDKELETLKRRLGLLKSLQEGRLRAVQHTMKYLHKEYPAVIVGEHSLIMIDKDLCTSLIPLTFIKKAEKHS